MLPNPGWAYNVLGWQRGEAEAALHLVLGCAGYIKSAFMPPNLNLCSYTLHFLLNIQPFYKARKHLFNPTINQASTMKSFTTISTFLFLFAAGLQAAPSSIARQFEAQLTFQGAPPDVAYYTLSVPTDGSVFQICTLPADSPFPPLSIYHHVYLYLSSYSK